MLEKSIVQEKLSASLSLLEDLASSFNNGELEKKLPLPSNQIGQQIWCVIGARESYLKGLMAGSWQGFSCSLNWEQTSDRDTVLKKLKESRSSIEAFISKVSDISVEQQGLLFSLIEHEAQHHGQIIRYLYGLELTIPESWKKRYSLD